MPACSLPPLSHLHWDITACNQNMMMCLWREVVVSDPLMSRGLDHSKRHLVKTQTCFWVVKWGCELWSSLCVTLIMALGQNAKLQARYLCFYTHMGSRQGFKALSGNICSKWFTPNVALSHDMKYSACWFFLRRLLNNAQKRLPVCNKRNPWTQSWFIFSSFSAYLFVVLFLPNFAPDPWPPTMCI